MTHRSFKSILLLVLFMAAGFTSSKAVVIYQYGFENLPGNGTTTSSPWTDTPDVLATGLSNSSWATNYSSGLFSSYSGSCGNSSCQSLAISGNNDPSSTTYTLTFTVNPGYALNVTGISFWDRESTDGPKTTTITFNSTTAFSNLTLAGTTGANTGLLTPTGSFTNLTGTFTLVMTLSGATNTGGTFRLDDFVIDGNVTTVSAINAYNVTGGGSLCAGGAGVAIGLANSDTGVTYQLQSSTYTNIGSAVAGTGSAISFGPQTTAGTYIVVATNNTTSDTATMTGSATVVVNPLPTVTLGSPVTQCGGTATLNAGNAGSTFLWSDNTTQQTDVVSATGTYSVTVTEGSTCSASASVSVTINTPPAISFAGSNLNICSGQFSTIAASGATSYLWSNNLTTASISVAPASTTTYTVTGTANGCTATASATVNVGSAIRDTIPMQICHGQSFNGHNTSGTYSDTLVVTGGCDSIVTVNLQVLPAVVSGASQTICAGQTYQGHSTSGTFTDTLTTGSGCDSIVTLQLTITAPGTGSATQTICAGQTYQGHSTSGTFTDTLTTGSGCDSIVILQLTVTAPVTGSTNQTICAGQTYQGHSTSGTFTDTLTTGSGCDSIVTLQLTVTPALTSSTSQTICSGLSYNGHTVSGLYHDTLQSVAGCDSIVSLNLVVLPPITLALSHAMCKYDTFMGYTTSGNYVDTLQAANGCDSLVYLQLTVNALPHVTLYLTFDTVCSNAATIAMSGGSPAGGYYSGQGISNSQFVPSSAPLGYDSIVYTYTDSNGCTKDRYEFAYTLTCTDSTDTTGKDTTALGINRVSNVIFHVLPNPAHDYLTIENAVTNSPYSLSLYDLLGRLVLYQPETNNLAGKATLDLRQLPAGLYLLNITEEGGQVSGFKVVKD
jgi:hypothetical protein